MAGTCLVRVTRRAHVAEEALAVGGGATPTKGGAGEADAAAVARIELCGVTSQLAVQLWSEESEEYLCGRRSATCDVMWTLPIYLAGFFPVV